MPHTSKILVLIVFIAIAGCAGLDSSSKFACTAPEGVNCQSLSGVYANSINGTLPSQQVHKSESGDGSQSGSKDPQRDPRYVWAGGIESDPKMLRYGSENDAMLSPRMMATPTSGMPIRKPPQVLRVWVAPWEDEVGDLHDQSYFYTMVSNGKWAIEASRKNISERFKPVYPLKTPNSAPLEEKSTKEKREPAVPNFSQNGTLPGSLTGQGNPLGGPLPLANKPLEDAQ